MKMFSIRYRAKDEGGRPERFEIFEWLAREGASRRLTPEEGITGWDPAVEFLVERGAKSTLAHRAVAQAILADQAYVVV